MSVLNGSFGQMMAGGPQAGARFPSRLAASSVASHESIEVVVAVVCWSLGLHSVMVSQVDVVFVAVVIVVGLLLAPVETVAP